MTSYVSRRARPGQALATDSVQHVQRDLGSEDGTGGPLRRAPLDPAGLVVAGLRVEVVAESPSTNAELLARSGAPQGTVLVAEFQTAGRGRLDRGWSSPPRAGLTFSVLLRPRAARSTWGWLPLLAGVALSSAVPGSSLKWPNDLMFELERKAAGILAQSDGAAVVVGIGLNVSTLAAELPAGATSLLLETGAEPDRTVLLRSVLQNLDDWYQRWHAAAGDAERCGLAAAYRERCATLGQRVRVTSGAAHIVGSAIAVDAAGRLVLDGGQAISAGDVTRLRAAEG